MSNTGDVQLSKTPGWTSNSYRAKRAMGSLHKYNELSPGDLSDDSEDIRMVAGDLISDIFHLLRKNNINIDEVISSSIGYFKYELSEEDDDPTSKE